MFGSCSSHHTVKNLLRESGGAGVTYIIPSPEQRPWSPSVGYQCVYESYFGEHTKLWFPIPRLVTSYAFHRDIAISQLLNGSLCIAVMLMVMAAEMDISMSVRMFEELTFTKAEPNGIFSVKMRAKYNVLTGHPNKTQDWQRAYFYIKSDEHAFEEPPGDDYRVLWNKELGRDLSFVTRIQSPTQRISSRVLKRSRRTAIFVGWISVESGYVVNKLGSPKVSFLGYLSLCLVLLVVVDWESRLPCVLGPRKSRLSLFTRKQQKLLDKAREMEGVPDLSALLKGKRQLLSKKTTPDVVPESTNYEEAGASKGRDSVTVDEDVSAEPSALSPKRKKKSKKAKRRVTDEAPGPDVPLGETVSLGEASKGSKVKKKKEKKKRPREEATFLADHDDMPKEGREAAPEDLVGADPIEAVPEDRPKKKTKKRSVEGAPRPIADGTTSVDSAGRKSLSPRAPLEKRKRVAASEGGSRSESAANERSAPGSAMRRGARSEGSLARRGGAEFPDRVQFSSDEKTPLIFNPLRCAEDPWWDEGNATERRSLLQR
ncbi:hypothetical protein Bca52824_048353 [Brassica carinata]|uniref:Uncharacterized protein n=1 Tax=Brassica carinata TaxID=52824 RepID=A0A8X7US44_BRACI|nr:hypothetical protein Bca52824_048353 [Brassica carinata]